LKTVRHAGTEGSAWLRVFPWLLADFPRMTGTSPAGRACYRTPAMSNEGWNERSRGLSGWLRLAPATCPSPTQPFDALPELTDGHDAAQIAKVAWSFFSKEKHLFLAMAKALRSAPFAQYNQTVEGLSLGT